MDNDEQNPFPIEDIPLMYIFSALSKKDTFNLCLTSKRFNFHMNNRYLWRNIFKHKLASSNSKGIKQCKIPELDIDWRRICCTMWRFDILLYGGVKDNYIDMVKLGMAMGFKFISNDGGILSKSLKMNRVEITKLFIDSMTDDQIKDIFTVEFLSRTIISDDHIDMVKLLMSYPIINNVIRKTSIDIIHGRKLNDTPVQVNVNPLIKLSCMNNKPKMLEYLLDILPQNNLSLFWYLKCFEDKTDSVECVDIIINHKDFDIKSIDRNIIEGIILAYISSHHHNYYNDYNTVSKILSIPGIHIGDPSIFLERMFLWAHYRYISLILSRPTTDRTKINAKYLLSIGSNDSIKYFAKMLDYDDINFEGCKIGYHMCQCGSEDIQKFLSNKSIDIDFDAVLDHILIGNLQLESYDLIRNDPRSNSYDPGKLLKGNLKQLSYSVMMRIKNFPLFDQYVCKDLIINLIQSSHIKFIIDLLGHVRFPKSIRRRPLANPVCYNKLIIHSVQVVNHKLRLQAYSYKIVVDIRGGTRTPEVCTSMTLKLSRDRNGEIVQSVI